MVHGCPAGVWSMFVRSMFEWSMFVLQGYVPCLYCPWLSCMYMVHGYSAPFCLFEILCVYCV